MVTDLDRERVLRLMAGVARSDRAAFRELYDRTSGRVFGLLRHMLESEAVAEEAMQDTYLTIWHRAGEFRVSRGSPMTWLLTNARYRAIDRLRKQGRETVTDELPDVPAEARTGPQAMAMGASDAALLRDCLGDLASDHRRCLDLAFFAGASHGEVAERLETPLGTVKSWIRRGLQSLKRCMEA